MIYFRRELLKNKQSVYLTFGHISKLCAGLWHSSLPSKGGITLTSVVPVEEFTGWLQVLKSLQKHPFQECTLTHKPCLLKCLALPISLLRFFIFSKHVSPHPGDILCLVSTAQRLSSQTTSLELRWTISFPRKIKECLKGKT